MEPPSYALKAKQVTTFCHKNKHAKKFGDCLHSPPPQSEGFDTISRSSQPAYCPKIRDFREPDDTLCSLGTNSTNSMVTDLPSGQNNF